VWEFPATKWKASQAAVSARKWFEMLAAVLKAPGLRRAPRQRLGDAMVRIAGAMVKLNARWKKPDAAHLAWTPRSWNRIRRHAQHEQARQAGAIQGSDQVMTVNPVPGSDPGEGDKARQGDAQPHGGLGVDGGSAQSTRLNPGVDSGGRPLPRSAGGHAEAYDRGAASTRVSPPRGPAVASDPPPDRPPWPWPCGAATGTSPSRTRSSQASELLSQCGSQARGAFD